MDNERSIRRDEIAAWLPDETKADGARIGDRVAWGRLAALPEATDAVAAAEDLSGRPMPELTPVPVAGGGVQRTGRDYAARVLDTEFSDGRDLVRYDLAKAYDVPQLKSLVRTVVFERDAMRVTVEDRVVFDRPSAFEVPVVTYRGLKGDPASGRFTLCHPGGGRSLSVSVTGSSPLAFHLERIDNPGMESVSRLGFSLAKPQMRAVVKTVFEAY